MKMGSYMETGPKGCLQHHHHHHRLKSHHHYDHHCHINLGSTLFGLLIPPTSRTWGFRPNLASGFLSSCLILSYIISHILSSSCLILSYIISHILSSSCLIFSYIISHIFSSSYLIISYIL